MPTLKYAFEKGGPTRAEISWSGIWKNIRVRLDGTELGTITSRNEFLQGKRFVLADGHALSVQFLQKTPGGGLQVHFDGEPLAGSGSGPEEKLKYTFQFIYFLAAVNIVAGALVDLLQVPFLLNAGIGRGSLIFGLLFAVLGWFVQRKSIAALALVVFLFALDGIMLVVGSVVNGNPVAVGAIVGRVVLIVTMIPGFSAIRALRDERARSSLKYSPSLPPVVARVELILAEVPPNSFNPNVPRAGWIVGGLILVAVATVVYLAMKPAGQAR